MTTAITLTTRGNNRMNVNSAQILEQARVRLKALAGKQHELADTREEILIGRESLGSKGKQVRLQRDRTGNAEVAFMNALRKQYNSSGASFPAEVDVAYSIVDAERTQLSLLEAEHLEAEEDLGAQEWTLMEQENDLYQYDLQQILVEEPASDQTEDISARDVPSMNHLELISPSATVQYQVARVEHIRLINRFKTMRKLVADIIDATTLNVDEAELLDLGTSEFAATFSELLSQIAACEARLQHLQSDRDNRYGASSQRKSRTSEPLPVTRKLVTSSDTASRACSDSALPNSDDQIPVIHRIREWLLDCLNQSAVEKAQYVSILLGYLDDFGFEIRDWEVLAAEAWSHDDQTDPTEAAQPFIDLPFSAQEMRQDDDAYGEAIRDDQVRSTSDALGTKPPQLRADSSVSLLGDLFVPSVETLPSISDVDGSIELVVPRMAFAGAQGDDLPTSADFSEPERSSPTRSHKHGAESPIINLVIVPDIDSRYDSVQDCSKGRLDIMKPPVHASAQQSIEGNCPHTAQDFNDALTQGDRAILPIPDIIYSPPEWSVGLRCFYVFGLAADDNVAEVYLSNDRLDRLHNVEVMLPSTVDERNER